MGVLLGGRRGSDVRSLGFTRLVTNADGKGLKEVGARALYRHGARRGVRVLCARFFPDPTVGNRSARRGARPRPGRRRDRGRDPARVRPLHHGRLRRSRGRHARRVGTVAGISARRRRRADRGRAVAFRRRARGDPDAHRRDDPARRRRRRDGRGHEPRAGDGRRRRDRSARRGRPRREHPLGRRRHHARRRRRAGRAAAARAGRRRPRRARNHEGRRLRAPARGDRVDRR